MQRFAAILFIITKNWGKQMSFNRGMDQQIVVYSYKEILVNDKKKSPTKIWKDIGET